MEQLDKPYAEWTKNQREWLDKKVILFRSPRGAKAKKLYDSLYREREMARLSGNDSVPSYTQQASKAAGFVVSSLLNNLGLRVFRSTFLIYG
jgi:hypothetical protein